ncbi:hypothetical protein DFH27DRAFT_527309 [Peziza echinospora]|nr:hypothetical protein DFH27DRAFT_527309 [Peziza echinospora]
MSCVGYSGIVNKQSKIPHLDISILVYRLRSTQRIAAGIITPPGTDLGTFKGSHTQWPLKGSRKRPASTEYYHWEETYEPLDEFQHAVTDRVVVFEDEYHDFSAAQFAEAALDINDIALKDEDGFPVQDEYRIMEDTGEEHEGKIDLQPFARDDSDKHGSDPGLDDGLRKVADRDCAYRAAINLQLFTDSFLEPPIESGNVYYSGLCRQFVKAAYENILKVHRSVCPNSAMAKSKSFLAVKDFECVVCLENMADTVLLPCNHLVLCKGCCDIVYAKRVDLTIPPKLCPVCRVKIEDTLTGASAG